MDKLLMVHVRAKDSRTTLNLELDTGKYISDCEDGICGYTFGIDALLPLFTSEVFDKLGNSVYIYIYVYILYNDISLKDYTSICMYV